MVPACMACIVFTIGSGFRNIFQCSPVEYAFDKEIFEGGMCANHTAFWFANAGFNILSDVVITVIPAFFIKML
jgi:hypothetical protein